MGLMDKVKGLVGGNKDKLGQGVDKGAEVAQEKLPDQYDAKADQAADAAKEQIDKLDG